MLLAFGDSHRNTSALNTIHSIILQEQPELFVHTGDNYADFHFLKKKTKILGYGVKGNCDLGFIPGISEELIFEYCQKRFFLTHGHFYNVKYSLGELISRARELAVDAVIFGHSHVQQAEQEGGIWLINPGSIPLPRGGSSAGYARITVESGCIKVNLIQV